MKVSFYFSVCVTASFSLYLSYCLDLQDRGETAAHRGCAHHEEEKVGRGPGQDHRTNQQVCQRLHQVGCE